MKLFRAHYVIDGIVILLAKELCEKISKTCKGAGAEKVWGCVSRGGEQEWKSLGPHVISCDLVDVLEQKCLMLLNCHLPLDSRLVSYQSHCVWESVSTAYRQCCWPAYRPTAHHRGHLQTVPVHADFLSFCLRGFSAWGWAGLCVGRQERLGSYCPRSGWVKTLVLCPSVEQF